MPWGFLDRCGPTAGRLPTSARRTRSGPNVTSEDGTNHVHGLEETSYQHVTLEPGQTKRYGAARPRTVPPRSDRKSTRLNSSHVKISYAVFCLKKKIKSNVTYLD